MGSTSISDINSTDSLFNFVVRDGHGIKGLVDLGLEKVPDQYIHPDGEHIDKWSARSRTDCPPPIDLSKLDGPEHDQVVDDIVRAAETIGFFQVVNHGIPQELLDAVKDAAHKFFGQPPESKAAYLIGASPSNLVKYGTSFAPEKEASLEWKDYISMVYTTDEAARQLWPAECKEVLLNYVKRTMNMVRQILEALFSRLGVRLEDSRFNGLTWQKMVNMNYYPRCPNPDLTVGVGRHSDVGLITILLQDGIGGLYVKLEEEAEEWLAIPPIPGALVVNIGDSLQILSNGRYKSAEHRVRTSSSQSRVSIPVFTSPRSSEKIGPLPEAIKRDGVARYRDVVFKDYMINFFGKAHDGKKSLEFVSIPSYKNNKSDY